MWCYQKPGFEALLLAELQRQQQCSQFCDTLLKTEGASVPAHSCILSAISPHISSALSSTPPPPAGQSRLLEFQALGASTVLHMVKLLYSGEMAGEGEEEKLEAISAAAKLGIHGLVEVTRRECKSRNEVGVQTEPLILEGNEGRETLSDGEKDTRTQTEKLQVNTAPSSHSAASFGTMDMAVFQHSSLFPPHIPYVPISHIFPPSVSVESMQESIAAGETSVAVVAPPSTPTILPFSSQATPSAADPLSWCTGPQKAARDVTAGEQWEDEQYEQVQGNIPGCANYFLNPKKEKGSHRERLRRTRVAGVGGAKRARTGGRRARRRQKRTGGRGRGGLTQTMDVQEVDVSRLQKLFLQRWGIRTSRTGQGGGAAGRKLYLKTRELLKRAKRRNRRRMGQGGDVMPYRERLAGKRGHRKTPASPPQVEQPEPFDRVLEEVMMGLNILPNNNGASHYQPRLPASRSSYIGTYSGNALAQNEQQGQTTSLLEAGPGFHESTQVVPVERGAGSFSSANSEVPFLQPQGESELNEMLEHFFLSFERHVDSSTAREEVEMSGQSCSDAPVRSSQITDRHQNDEAETLARCSQPYKASAHRAVHSRNTEGSNYRSISVGKPASSSDAKTKIVHDRGEGQLQQMPALKLKKSGPLPVSDTLLGHSCQSLEVKRPPQRKASSSPVKSQSDSLFDKNQPVLSSRKIYPLRSRLRGEHRDSIPFLVAPLEYKQPPSGPSQPGHKRGRPRKNGQLLCLSNGESSTPAVPPQPVKPCDTEEQRDDATVAKRARFEQMAQLTSETYTCSSESADFDQAAIRIEEVIDVETVSLISVGDTEQMLTDEKMESSNEIIDVDGDVEEDIEVIRGSSPIPEPVIIN